MCYDAKFYDEYLTYVHRSCDSIRHRLYDICKYMCSDAQYASYVLSQALSCLARCTGNSQLAVELLAEYITKLEGSIAISSTGLHGAINTADASSHQLAVIELCSSLIASIVPASSQQQVAKLSSLLIQLSSTAVVQVSSTNQQSSRPLYDLRQVVLVSHAYSMTRIGLVACIPHLMLLLIAEFRCSYIIIVLYNVIDQEQQQ
jgi:hypothetical protein